MLCFCLFGCGEQGSQEIDLSQYSEEELVAMRDQIDGLLSGDEDEEKTPNEFNTSEIDKEADKIIQSYLSEVGKIYESDEYRELMNKKPETKINFLGYTGTLKLISNIADESTNAKKIYSLDFESDSYLQENDFDIFVDKLQIYGNYNLEDMGGWITDFIEDKPYRVDTILLPENNHLKVEWAVD